MSRLTSNLASVRRLAESEALQVSRDELAKQLARLDSQREEARQAAQQRDKEIRETTARAASEVRSALASDVYAALLPSVRSWLEEPARKTAREVITAFHVFARRCVEETGRELGARPITNIMISQLGPGLEPHIAHAAWAMAFGSSELANIEGALLLALREREASAVEKALSTMEDTITKLAHGHAGRAPSAKLTQRWEASNTALCEVDHAGLLAVFAPPAPVIPLSPFTHTKVVERGDYSERREGPPKGAA